MNGKFEQSSAYPYSVQPEGGYGSPTGKWQVVDVRSQKPVDDQLFASPAAAAMHINDVLKK